MDVLVAGGGPAGSIAAFLLARAGARVMIIDRARFPRDKLCGDTINPGALAILDRLGLSSVTEGGLRIEGMTVSGERGVRVTGDYGGAQHGLSLSRRVLDARLLEAAIAAGAQFEEGILVQRPLTTGDGRTVQGLEVKTPAGPAERRHASITIAADGAHSRIARAVRLARIPPAPRRWAVGATFRGVTGLATSGEMHVRVGCYMGVAPLPDGLANACVVTADRRALRSPDLLLTMLRQDLEIGERFDAAEIVSGPSVLGPLALDATSAGMPGLLLAGDAAGFIDPMTGDGLRFAFRGAELAAEEALRALESGWQHAHLRLWKGRRREFAAKWRFNRMLRALAGSPRAIRAAGRTAAVTPALLRYAIRYAGDARFA
jgi:flavin-dependent dehydrogenase